MAAPEVAKPLDSFRASSARLTDAWLATLSSLLAPAVGERGWPRVEENVRASVLEVVHGVGQAAEELWDRAEQEMAARARSKDKWFKVKMQTARIAASVQVKHKAAELEAAHRSQLEAQLRERRSGGDPTLAAAQDRIAELEEEVFGLGLTKSTMDEALSVSEKGRKAAEARAKDAEAAAEGLREAAAEANDLRDELEDARDELQSAREEARR